jgi:hypothetical protein
MKKSIFTKKIVIPAKLVPAGGKQGAGIQNKEIDSHFHGKPWIPACLSGRQVFTGMTTESLEKVFQQLVNSKLLLT